MSTSPMLKSALANAQAKAQRTYSLYIGMMFAGYLIQGAAMLSPAMLPKSDFSYWTLALQVLVLLTGSALMIVGAIRSRRTQRHLMLHAQFEQASE